MGAIGGLLGLNGGVNGTGISGPQGTAINAGTNAGQLQTAYNGNQNALGSQQALMQALQNQNGLGNQSQVYNQLQGVANGTGPNPAQAQLAQATGANTANQAALMAGQRGAGSNVGLLARQAAQQGANTQQQAAGQAATLQANQSLNALGQAGNIANTQVANQIGATGANTQAQQGEQNALQNANTAANSANVQMQDSINKANAGLAGQQMQGQQGLIGGLLGGAGAALGLADGGDVPGMYADGGQAGPQSILGKTLNVFSGMGGGSAGSNALQSGMSSFIGGAGHQIGNLLKSDPSVDRQGMGSSLNTPMAPTLGANTQTPGMSPGMNQMASQFGVTQMPSSNLTMPTMAKGGNVGSKLKNGGHVPGKAKIEGNSLKNDNVKALLSPGEGVIDRETMHSPGAVGDAARFVMAYINKKKARR